MKRKKKILPLIILLIVIAVVLIVVFLVIRPFSQDTEETKGAYVNSVAELKERGNNDGSITRFLGVVQAQDTWTLEKDSEKTVTEYYVNEGDTVSEGSLLLKYDVQKAEQDLAAAQIDLERIDSEISNYNTTISNLQNNLNNTSDSEERSKISLEIQNTQLQLREKELDRQSKVLSMNTLQDTIENSTVTSPIDGVVKTMNKSDSTDSSDSSSSSSGDDANALIVIMKTGDYQVKASVDELSIGQVVEGASMVVVSRTDSSLTWKGTVKKIDTESTNTNSSTSEYGYGSSSAESTTSYPFYVQLDSSEGLMLGQHVYVETDLGQAEAGAEDQLWLSSDYLNDVSGSSAWVYVENADGLLEKRQVTLGEYNEQLDKYQITDGLKDEDYIAIPVEGELKEGMEALHDY